MIVNNLIKELLKHKDFKKYAIDYCNCLLPLYDSDFKELDLYNKLVVIVNDIDLDFSTMLDSNNINKRIIAKIAYLVFNDSCLLKNELNNDLLYYSIYIE